MHYLLGLYIIHFKVNFSGVKSRSGLHIAIFYLEKKKIDKFWKFNDFSQFLSATKKWEFYEKKEFLYIGHF